MKTLILLALLTSGSAHALIDTHRVVSDAKDTAEYWFDQAIDKYKGQNEKILRRARRAIRKSEVHWFKDRGTTYARCNSTALAFNVVGDNDNMKDDFYLCARLIRKLDELEGEKSYSYAREYLAQVLVHEAIHTAGISGECTTTEWEALVLRKGNGGVIFRNGYWDKCRID